MKTKAKKQCIVPIHSKIKDITESVYTVRDVEWLRKGLEKMQ